VCQIFISELGVYGTDWVEMYQYGLNFSMLDELFKTFGFIILLLAWIQYSKSPIWTKKGKRSGVLMVVLTGISIFTNSLSVVYIQIEKYLFRIDRWAQIGRQYIIPLLWDNIIGGCWFISIYFIPILLSIGYFILARGIQQINLRKKSELLSEI
jgi:hypothetical protein